MDNTPISRDTMRGLKAVTDEEYRLRKIKDMVSNIYQQTRAKARTSCETYYTVDTRFIITGSLGNPKDKADIQNDLRTLFPDCSVEYQILPVGNTNIYTEFIVIDWS